MSKFCAKCGAENNDDIVFCKNCYNRFENVNQGFNPQYQNQQYQQYQYQNQYYQNPKEPGKGFGIASLCLGIESFSLTIAGLYYVFVICMFAIMAAASSDFPDAMLFMYFIEVGIFLFFSLVCGVLGLVFSKVAEGKGYKNGISRASRIVSTIGLIGCGIAIILVIFAAMFLATILH